MTGTQAIAAPIAPVACPRLPHHFPSQGPPLPPLSPAPGDWPCSKAITVSPRSPLAVPAALLDPAPHAAPERPTAAPALL
eukprot:38480-Eustigmatos_ZCMA.PRE.1